jgi:hypothetical protein
VIHIRFAQRRLPVIRFPDLLDRRIGVTTRIEQHVLRGRIPDPASWAEPGSAGRCCSPEQLHDPYLPVGGATGVERVHVVDLLPVPHDKSIHKLD